MQGSEQPSEGVGQNDHEEKQKKPLMSVPSESLLRHFQAHFLLFHLHRFYLGCGGVITPIPQASSQSQRLVCLRTPSSETTDSDLIWDHLGLGELWSVVKLLCVDAAACAEKLQQ